jgi:peptide/nickel transport system ATP-binding protein
MNRKEFRKLRCEMQIVFQDPYESLDPRMTVFDLLAEPLEVNRIAQARRQKEERIYKVLDAVRLIPPKDFARRFPHELSGGQRQRVVIARALILQPRFMVADEPVSMLDASVRTEILNLLFDLRSRYNLTYMYITHDLAQARYVGDRLIIMYLGKIMEKGPVEDIIKDPIHPYTRALISHVPVPDPTLKRERIHVKGETPSPIDMPSGCRFHPRCPYMKEICREEEPKLEAHGSRYSACHFFK